MKNDRRKSYSEIWNRRFLLTALCQEDKQRCCVVLQNKGTHKVGEAISTEKFVQEDDDTLLVFTDIKSIDVLVDKLFEAKLMMKGQFKTNRTVEYDY